MPRFVAWVNGQYNPVIRANQSLKKQVEGFPGSTVIKNLPVNEGDTGSIPDPGRSHMLWNNQAHVLQPLSLCSRAQSSVGKEPA